MSASSHSVLGQTLSLPIEKLQAEYDVVVVGSGYGASVSALRFAEEGYTVAVLERGIERRTGEYPDELLHASENLRVTSAAGTIGRADALFDLHLHHDMHVMCGSGLGGTSQINGNVVLEPTAEVWSDDAWPQVLRNQQATLQPYYARARDMLAVRVCADESQPKFQALQRSAAAVGAKATLATLTVNFDIDGVNRHGAMQKPCNGCGDCVSGCNVGAKNTLIKNYLPAAVRAGAEIFCGLTVDDVEKKGERWEVNFRHSADHTTGCVRAARVVLGAGAMGSTGVLLRSREKGLQLSPTLGEKFSGNGDVIAFGYGGKHLVNAVGRGRAHLTPETFVGPCITGVIELRDTELSRQIVIEDGVLPSALQSLLPAVFYEAAAVLGIGDPAHPAQKHDFGELVHNSYSGAMQNTQTLLVMSHDGSGGRVRLDGERVAVDWPQVGNNASFAYVDEVLTKAGEADASTYVRNPAWTPAFGKQLITVHPLGGCAMGQDGSHGVVDDCGRVYCGDGPEVHAGLMVLDGSIMPRSLGVNPLLTITALAERACEKMILLSEKGLCRNSELA